MAEITIRTILASDSLAEMVEKINEGLAALVELQGGPRGKLGKQGIPGLPGMQGLRGRRGETGRHGTRLIFVNQVARDAGSTDYSDSDLYISEDLASDWIARLPDLDMLNDIVNEEDEFHRPYYVGDTFLSESKILMNRGLQEALDLSENEIDDLLDDNKQSIYTYFKIQVNPEYERGASRFKYKYSIFSLDKLTLLDGIWACNVIESLNLSALTPTNTNNLKFNRLDSITNSVISSFTSNMYLSAYEELSNSLAVEEMISLTANEELLLWNRTHFKLSIDQVFPMTTLDTLDSGFDAISEIVFKNVATKPNQDGNIELDIRVRRHYLDMWDGMSYDGWEQNSANVDLDGLKEMHFSLFKDTTPILYLGVNEERTGDKRDDFNNFGIFIKRIDLDNTTNAIAGLGTVPFFNTDARDPRTIRKKAIMIIGNDTENDTYIKSENVWGEGNFISEFNSLHILPNPSNIPSLVGGHGIKFGKQKQFYSSFLSYKTLINETGKVAGHPTERSSSVFFGLANYGDSSMELQKNDTVRRIFTFDTGIEMRATFRTHSIENSMNAYLTKMLTHDKKISTSQIWRIDESGRFRYRYDTQQYEDREISDALFSIENTPQTRPGAVGLPSVLKVQTSVQNDLNIIHRMLYGVGQLNKMSLISNDRQILGIECTPEASGQGSPSVAHFVGGPDAEDKLIFNYWAGIEKDTMFINGGLGSGTIYDFKPSNVGIGANVKLFLRGGHAYGIAEHLHDAETSKNPEKISSAFAMQDGFQRKYRVLTSIDDLGNALWQKPILSRGVVSLNNTHIMENMGGDGVTHSDTARPHSDDKIFAKYGEYVPGATPTWRICANNKTPMETLFITMDVLQTFEINILNPSFADEGIANTNPEIELFIIGENYSTQTNTFRFDISMNGISIIKGNDDVQALTNHEKHLVFGPDALLKDQFLYMRLKYMRGFLRATNATTVPGMGTGKWYIMEKYVTGLTGREYSREFFREPNVIYTGDN